MDVASECPRGIASDNYDMLRGIRYRSIAGLSLGPALDGIEMRMVSDRELERLAYRMDQGMRIESLPGYLRAMVKKNALRGLGDLYYLIRNDEVVEKALIFNNAVIKAGRMGHDITIVRVTDADVRDIERDGNKTIEGYDVRIVGDELAFAELSYPVLIYEDFGAGDEPVRTRAMCPVCQRDLRRRTFRCPNCNKKLRWEEKAPSIRKI